MANLSREELLLKPHWNYEDICAFVDCKKSKAYQIIAIVKKEFNGSIKYNPSFVKRDSVIAYLGSSIERELYILEERRKGDEKTL